MEYEQIKEKAKKLIIENNLKRDDFIFILNNIEVDGSLEFKKKGETLHIAFEDWMLEKFSKRKMYEEISGIVGKSDVVDMENIDTSSVHVLELMKKVQSLHDSNVKLRKHYRDSFRPVIKTDDVLSEIAENSKHLKDFVRTEYIAHSSDITGIVQISDAHLNEIIDEPNNKYDFKIASQRLKYYIQNAIKFFLDNGITNVYFLNTGDNINSDRRNSELINMATSRARATILASKLFMYAIEELSQHFNVNVAFVSSNESRIDKELSLDSLSASNNFDLIIYDILKIAFKGTSVNFIDCDNVEGVIKIGNHKVILTHGCHIKDYGMQKTIQEIKGKHASRGDLISFVFSGDKHECLISSKFARSGSLCGGNGYSDQMLSFDSAPSQNVYIMYDNGIIEGKRIDLRNANCNGYDIDKELKEMNIRGLN